MIIKLWKYCLRYSEWSFNAYSGFCHLAERRRFHRTRSAAAAARRGRPSHVRAAAAERPRSGHRHVELGRRADLPQRSLLRPDDDDRLRVHVQKAGVPRVRAQPGRGWRPAPRNQRVHSERRLWGGDCGNSVRHIFCKFISINTIDNNTFMQIVCVFCWIML